MEVIEVRVGEQDQVDGGQVLDAQTGALEAFEQEEPIGEIGIDDGVEPLELDQERRMADPRQGQLIVLQVRKVGDLDRPDRRRLEGMPDHLAEKGPRIEMVSGRQVPERARDLAPAVPHGFGQRGMSRQRLMVQERIHRFGLNVASGFPGRKRSGLSRGPACP